MKIKLSIFILFLVGSLQATTLAQAVRKGLEYDPALSGEIRNHNAKLKSISVAGSGYLPKIDLHAGIGYEKSQKSSGRYARREVSVHFRQPIFDGFKTAYDVASAQAESNATRFALYALAGNKALKIIKAYLDVLKMQEIVALAQGNLNTHRKIVRSIKKRYERGVTNKADFIQIKGRIESAETNLFSSMNNLNDARAVYLSLVGIMPSHLQKVHASAVRIPRTLKQTIQQAIRHHPTGHSARKNIELAQNKRGQAESAFLPHVFADISANHERDVSGSQNTYQGMVRMEWNIFNGLKDAKRTEIAQLEVLRARDKARDTRRQLELEARLSWNAYQALRHQLAPINEHVHYAKEATKLYDEQYNVNKRSLIDVLNSQIEYFNARKTYIDTKYNEIVAKYRILDSIGILNSRLGIMKHKKKKIVRAY